MDLLLELKVLRKRYRSSFVERLVLEEERFMHVRGAFIPTQRRVKHDVYSAA